MQDYTLQHQNKSNHKYKSWQYNDKIISKGLVLIRNLCRVNKDDNTASLIIT